MSRCQVLINMVDMVMALSVALIIKTITILLVIIITFKDRTITRTQIFISAQCMFIEAM